MNYTKTINSITTHIITLPNKEAIRLLQTADYMKHYVSIPTNAKFCVDAKSNVIITWETKAGKEIVVK